MCVVAHVLLCCKNMISVWCLFLFFSFRYIQSLTTNVSYVRYKEVYSAAAEIIGLILKSMTDMGEV